jgi:hypothetical protein
MTYQPTRPDTNPTRVVGAVNPTRPTGVHPDLRVPTSKPTGVHPDITGTKTAPGVGGTQEQADAYATLKGLLDQYGLGSLADWAWQQLLNNHSPDQIMLEMYNTPEFKQRFPAIEARQKAGLPPISPAEYIAYESAAGQIMRAAGFPPGFYDHPDDFTNYIAGNVSIAEVSQRASVYQQAAYSVPAETRATLRDLYGVDEGGLAAFFADPNRALPLLQQQFTASQIGGEAQLQHFGPLSRSEAERLASMGVTDQQAAAGFGQVAHAQELFQVLPGEATGAPGRDAALGVVAGDQSAVDAVQRQADRRKAQFQGGGQFAEGQRGVSGLGSARTN